MPESSTIEIIAEGLAFPEGPVVLPDGSVLVVEIRRGTVTRVWNGGSEVVAHLGGGPNGAAIGPDGALYVCNNGGFDWDAGGIPPPDYDCGRIERVDLATGRFERVYDVIGEYKLAGPNDLVFDRNGHFWFTDFGKYRTRSKDRSGLYYGRSDGSLLNEAAYGYIGLNGVGLSPDETVVYAADTETARLLAFDIIGEGEVDPGVARLPGRCVAVQPENLWFDSLAVQADGRICVATLGNGGITTIAPDGRCSFTPMPDPHVTNIAFGGADMRDAYMTLSGVGQLIKTRWPEPGLKLNFNPY